VVQGLLESWKAQKEGLVKGNGRKDEIGIRKDIKGVVQ
jgi:hypothetical protein